MRQVHGRTWACHSNPSKPCIGAIEWQKNKGLLYNVEDINLLTEDSAWHLFTQNFYNKNEMSLEKQALSFLTPEMATNIHERNRAKGFYECSDEKYFFHHQKLEMIKELAEASEAEKKDLVVDVDVVINTHADAAHTGELDIVFFEGAIKDTIQDEMADFVIRVMDYLGFLIKECKTVDDLLTRSSGRNPEGIFSDFTTQLEHKIGWPKSVENPKGLNYETSSAILEIMDLVTANRLGQAMAYAVTFCEVRGFELIKHIEMKLAYNAQRKKLHGKAY